jgi:hypothetical protein
MGANDRESLPGDPKRAGRHTACETEKQRQQCDGSPAGRRASCLGSRPRVHAPNAKTQVRGARAEGIGAFRAVAHSWRVRRRLRLRGRTSRSRLGLAASMRRRGGRRRRGSRSQPRHVAPRTRTPRNAGDHACARSDPNARRRRSRGEVRVRVERLGRRGPRRGRLRLLRWRRRIRWSDRRGRHWCCPSGRRTRRGRRLRCGRRLGRRGRAGSAPRRKQAERVDVRLRSADPDAEVHIGHGVLRLPGWARLRERLALGNRLPSANVQLAEVRQRRLVLAGRDRDGEAVDRYRPGERHRAGHGRAKRGRAAQRDVDTTVLAARVGIAAHGESAQDRAVRGPCPCPRRRAGREGKDGRAGETDEPPRCLRREHEATVARACACGNAKLPSCYRERR